MLEIIIILFLLLFLIYSQTMGYYTLMPDNNQIMESQHIPQYISLRAFNQPTPKPLPKLTYNNDPKDTLYNPYAPPLKHYENRDTYSQIGYINSQGEKPMPLFGKKCKRNHDKWNYYTISNDIKLPVIYNKKSCTSEYGCNELMNGDTIYVNGLDNIFSVNIYETDMHY